MSGNRFINTLRDSGYRWVGGAPVGDPFCEVCHAATARFDVLTEYLHCEFEYKVCRDCYLELEAKLPRKEET